MGEIVFKYTARQDIPQSEYVFKYFYENSIENSFAYQRFIARVSGTLFQNPVAINKVATGFFDLKYLSNGLSISKAKKSFEELKQGYEVYKIKYPTVSFQAYIIHKKIRTGSINIDKEIYKLPKKYNIADSNCPVYRLVSPVLIPKTYFAKQDYFGYINKSFLIYNKSVDKNGNIYKNIIFTRDSFLSYFPGSFMNVKKEDMYINITKYLPITKDFVLNYFNQWINFNKTTIVVNYSKFHSFNRKNNIVNIEQQIIMQRPINICNINPILYGYRPTKWNLYNQQIPIDRKMDPLNTNIYENVIVQPIDYYKHIMGNPLITIHKKDYLMSLYNNDYFITRMDCVKDIFTTQNEWLSKRDRVAIINDSYYIERNFRHQLTLNDTFYLYKNTLPGMGQYDTYYVNRGFRNIVGFNWTYYITRSFRNGMKNTDNMYQLTKNYNSAMFLNNTYYIDKKPRDNVSLYIDDMFLFRDNKHNTLLDETHLFLYRKPREPLKIYEPGIFMFLDSHDFDIYEHDRWLSKIRKDAHAFVYSIPVNKYFITHIFDDSSIMQFVEKSYWNLSMNQDTFIHRYYRPTKLNKEDYFAFKEKRPFVIGNNGTTIFKKVINMDIYNFTRFAELYDKYTDIQYNNNFFIDSPLPTGTFDKGFTLYKNALKTSIEYDEEFIFKNMQDLMYISKAMNGYDGMIIPISKVKDQAYIDSINKMLVKYYKDILINTNITSSVIPKDIFTNGNELICDKQEFDVHIDYQNLLIAKQQLKTALNKDTYVNKKGFICQIDSKIWLSKNEKDTNSFYKEKEEIKFQKRYHNTNIDNLIEIDKEQKKGHTNIDLWITSNKYGELLDSLFVEKTDKICYYEYGILADHSKLDMIINDTEFAMVDNVKPTGLFDWTSAVNNKNMDLYTSGIFSTTPTHNLEILHDMLNSESIEKDLNILPNDFHNWAWVEEDPDPFGNTVFGIDELLIPEKDTRYEDFTDIIFNKDTMLPRDPIKQINDTTFIGKYPTKFPIPEHNDVGIVYVDVRTTIMHDIFLQYYKIWQSNLFKFGAMTMVQSSKLMLEYTYRWILGNYQTDQLEEALRVFRQIRWYTERAIIQNSQYIIHYEYDDLVSDLKNGNVNINNDLDSNNTMYIDTKLGVIRNNILYLNTSDAYVTFEFKNMVDTTFSFSLSNRIGSVNIYLNGVVVKTINGSSMNISIDVPYTGNTNKVKIEKAAADNLDGTFYIGYIKVKNQSFRELSVEFDPTLRNGNKPLNEVAQKMIAWANAYPNVQETYDELKKANLGVSETYKKMKAYWATHHQDKIKGKRLTIKEV